MVYSEYTWIFVVGILVACVAAFGIGANDVANSFGSSVGTKALTMWQAVLIAAVCEFLGAFFLGAGVTDTVKSGVANTGYFADLPDVFMYGFLCVLIAAAIWDNLACHLELPVSTTHTTIGAVVGFCLASGGSDAVIWAKSKDEFPYFSGFVSIICSWFIAPLLSGIVVAILYVILRTFVLRSKHSFALAFWLLPLFTAALFGLIVGFIIQVGGKNKTWDAQSDVTVLWISVCFAVGAAIFTLAVVMPLLKRKAVREEAALQQRLAQLQAEKAAAADSAKGLEKEGLEGDMVKDTRAPTDDAAIAIDVADRKDNAVDPELMARAMHDIDMANGAPDWTDKVAAKYHAWVADSKWGKAVFQNRFSRVLAKGLFYDVHQVVSEDRNVAQVWANAEVFDFKTERLFRYLQVFSAMAMSFAHGSNDVANAMGPLAAIYETWDKQKVPSKKTTVPQWVLALGGVWIVIGLATYGYKIMRVLGVKSVKLTNVRGFVVEWSTALVVVLASRFGLPVSTTQVVSGAILSMGLFEGRRGVNWKVAVKIFAGWVITVFFAAGVAAALTALGVYSPNKNSTTAINNASDTINGQTLAQLQQLNQTALSSNDASLESQVVSYNDTLTSLYNPVRDIEGTANLQTETFNLYNTTFLSS
jgi:solute carrier family 20 (sodium-dependent phosphate transporter)